MQGFTSHTTKTEPMWRDSDGCSSTKVFSSTEPTAGKLLNRLLHTSCVCVCVCMVGGSIKKQLCPIHLQALQHYSPPSHFYPFSSFSTPPPHAPCQKPLLLCRLPVSFQTHSHGSNAPSENRLHTQTLLERHIVPTFQIYCKFSFAPHCLM